MKVIEVEHLYKAIGQIPIFQGLSLTVNSGEVYGLLGQQGVGKTTFLLVLLGLVHPDRGTIRVLGEEDLSLARQRIGLLPERLNYHIRYSVREYLNTLGQFSGLYGSALAVRVDELLAALGLEAVARRRLEHLSKGALQRVGLAQALLHDPDLLLLDEPTLVLDPAGRLEMLDLLRQLREQGYTVIIVSPQADELALLCDRVGILHEGRLAIELSSGQIQTGGLGVTLRLPPLQPEQIARLQSIAPTVSYTNGELVIQPGSQEVQSQVLRALLDEQITLLSFQPLDRPLERLYLQVVRGEPLTPPPVPTVATRPGEGDTLLHELLRREGT